MRRATHKSKILSLLKEVSKDKNPLCTHLAAILLEYPNFEAITDKEFFFLIEKYLAIKELDISLQHDSSLDTIIKEGMDLDSILDDEEEY